MRPTLEGDDQAVRAAIVLAAGVTSALIFAFDAVSPVGVADGFLYIVPILFGLWSPGRRYLTGAVATALVLNVLGFLASPPSGEQVWIGVTNRVIAGLVILTTAWVIRRKQLTDERLRDSYRALEDLKFALDQASIVARTDQRGVIDYVNDNFCEISGYSREELLGQDHRIINSGYHPKEFIRNLWETIARGTVWRDEIRNQAKDGTIYWVDTTIVPFLHPDGKPYQYLAIRTDITDRKRTDEALLRLAAIIETSDDAIIGKTLDGIITSWNKGGERIYGYRADEVQGRSVTLLLPPDRTNEYATLLERMGRGERIAHLETKRVRRDGSTFDVSLTLSPVLDDLGRIAGASAIERDITEMKRVEETLRERAALARLGEMAAVVAHEVKNPLAGIGGALQIIRERLPADGRDREVLAEILARLDGLNSLVEDLLVFARPRAPRLAPLHVRPLLRETAAHLGRDPDMARVVVEVTGEDPLLQGDAGLLRDAFFNLLLNAAHAMGRDGRIRIGVATGDGHCRVDVADSGPGIPPEIRPKIFEPFFTTKSRGTGLGLPVVKRVVEAHGGDVTLDYPPGGGTVATIRLPLA